MTVEVEVAQVGELFVVAHFGHHLREQLRVLPFVLGVDELPQQLEVVAFDPRHFAELLQNVEGVEEVGAAEDALRAQLLQRLVNRLLLVSDDGLRTAPHHAEELAEEELIGEHRLTVGDHEAVDGDALALGGAAEDADEVLLRGFGVLPDEAEGEVEPHKLPVFEVQLAHLRSDDHDDVGDVPMVRVHPFVLVLRLLVHQLRLPKGVQFTILLQQNLILLH